MSAGLCDDEIKWEHKTWATKVSVHYSVVAVDGDVRWQVTSAGAFRAIPVMAP